MSAPTIYEVLLLDDKVRCAWSPLCDRIADGVVTHPVLGYVPTCGRCAVHYQLDLIPATWEIES